MKIKLIYFSFIILFIVSILGSSNTCKSQPIINPNKYECPRITETKFGNFLIFQNIIIHPSSNSKCEVLIKASPVNPSILFATAMTWQTVGVYTSTNGGVNWYGSDSVNCSPHVLHGGDPGITIDKNGVFIITGLGGFPLTNNPNSVISNYSTNNGISFAPTVVVSGGATGVQDKDFVWTDDNPSSPFYGRSYAAWSDRSELIKLSFTTNSGLSWSDTISASPFNNQAGSTLLGCDGDVGPNGNVYVVWAKCRQGELTEDSLGFAESTNGGINWKSSSNGVLHITGIRTDNLAPYGFKVNGFPRISIDKSNGSRRGWIYVVVAEKIPSASDSADIYLLRSRDQGVTWDAPIRVNQDTPGNGKKQFFSAINVDKNGGLYVVYYDNRNTSPDSAEIYMSYSNDGGNSWADVLVSDHRFKPKPISTLFMGDYIGITSANDKVWPIWMDDRSGVMQAITTSIIVPIGINPISGIIPEQFVLSQNYPNPFNSETEIKFEIPKRSFTKLVLYDILGNDVSTLVNDELNPGSYIVNFNGSYLSSGVYFYKLSTNDFNETKKMIILK